MKNKKIILVIVSIIIVCFIVGAVFFIIKNIFTEENIITENIKKEKITSATILIQENDKEEVSNKSKQFYYTLEDLMNSKMVKSVVEEKYGEIGNVKFEIIEDTQIIRVIYVCDNHTEEESKQILQELIQEFSKRIEEIYDLNVYIIDEPEITIRGVKE